MLPQGGGTRGNVHDQPNATPVCARCRERATGRVKREFQRLLVYLNLDGELYGNAVLAGATGESIARHHVPECAQSGVAVPRKLT